jgi:hypothetical protein
VLLAIGFTKGVKENTGTEIDFPSLRRMFYIGIPLQGVKGGTVCSTQQTWVKYIESGCHPILVNCLIFFFGIYK